MSKKKVGIVGLGHVGSTMKELFTDAAVFDEVKSIGTREEINACEVAFVCVPTPRAEDGHCDASIVEYVLDWIESEVVVLRSTVPVGFTMSPSLISLSDPRITTPTLSSSRFCAMPYTSSLNWTSSPAMQLSSP